MLKNTNRQKNWDKFWFDNRILKLHISQLIAKTELKQRSLNQIRNCLTGHIQAWSTFFDQKMLKYFSDFHNWNFSVLWLKWTQTMEMIQSMRHTQIWHHIFLIKNFRNIQIWHHLSSGPKMLNYFNDFYNWHFSILLQKWTKASKMK